MTARRRLTNDPRELWDHYEEMTDESADRANWIDEEIRTMPDDPEQPDIFPETLTSRPSSSVCMTVVVNEPKDEARRAKLRVVPT